jgi:hypothetical protein
MERYRVDIEEAIEVKMAFFTAKVYKSEKYGYFRRR